MGKTKELYIQYMNDRFVSDKAVEEYMYQQSKYEQEMWEAWLKDQEKETDSITVRDFINNYVGSVDIPTFWELLLEHDPTAKIGNSYKRNILLGVLVRVEKKQ